MQTGLVIALTALLMVVLSKFFGAPPRPFAQYSEQDFEKMAIEFEKKKKLWGPIGIIVGLPCLTIIFGCILWPFFAIEAKLTQGDIVFLPEIEANSLTVGLIFAFGAIIHLGNYIVRKTLKDKYDLYLIYYHQKQGINYEKLARGWLVFFAAIAFGYMLLCDGWFFKIKGQKIEFSEFLSFTTERHTVKDIKNVVFSPKQIAPNGNITDFARHKIEFKNGSYWVVDNWLTGNVSNDSLVRFLEAQTHLKTTYEPVADW